ncbi:DUF6298 domain-containing protein [Siphonobacter aquaeclarae]|uniref:DUF6298 domain-containing protein n=1 Tax=Siphonobacter aquaeclarae TaxID=563176 RepID=A0A1G9IZU3_9BACT|nr:DUF6298 domain-containing protein [Siphonobacter aquaeclarae]SDL30625.1 hypothetical protein SAMN04488090_0687 [Siphonobacter aquaeclarae]
MRCFLFFLLLFPAGLYAQEKKPLSADAGGRLTYVPDERGNRIPDFSYAGFAAGTESIPIAGVQVTVPACAGDATRRIQAALDYVAALPAGKDGIRGAVLLGKGVFEVAGSLKIKASGVVLRGSGIEATTLRGTGYSREDLIILSGETVRRLLSPETPVADPYVPVNALKITVQDPGDWKAGDRVVIRRPSTAEWIRTLGADHFGGGVTALGWKAGQRDLFWDREIIAVEGNTLLLDAPLTTALDVSFGGGTAARQDMSRRITRSGVENLRLESTYDLSNPKDEDHRWTAISIAGAEDAWVRQVVFAHFAGSAVRVQESARRVTVEDCLALEPVSEIGAERRNTFYTNGQQTLFQRLYSENGYHDFAVGFCATGPNAFVQCEAHLPLSFSGAIDSWASGILFDIVNSDGNALRFANLGQDAGGAGWAAANSVFWQCSAARVACDRPPTAQNWAFGTWAQFQGDGYWDQSNEHIQPRSLYYAQLRERIGDKVQGILLPVTSEASSSPRVEVAAELTREAVHPALTLAVFIRDAAKRLPLPVTESGKSIDQLALPSPEKKKSADAMTVRDGRLVRGKTLVNGERREVPWWNGSARPYGLKNPRPHITRFVPGRSGPGLTDDLSSMTDSLQKQHIVAIDHNYGLWYDRRRDDHERIRRMDGEVVPPFYELPFARSGKGTAWDGLSQYDLTKYNRWYWGRLQEFADLADEKGLLLLHQNYFQHNILEAGAHYADFPWRTANNINQTGFPEPAPYAGDKRIFMAEQFYDVSNPARRALHRAYIRQCLSNFSGNTGVIQLTGAEFTGPAAFVRFWLSVIGEWEKETNKPVLAALSTTKDVQDSLLADPETARLVDLIDIRYWHYQADGTTYAPAGGRNLAPRQHARLLKPKKTSFEQVYRAVREYREKYPDKAVMYSGDQYDSMGWAVLLAGGSLPVIPEVTDSRFAADIAAMGPLSGLQGLGNPSVGYVLAGEGQLTPATGTWEWKIIDRKTGRVSTTVRKVKGGLPLTFKALESEVIWLKRK